MTQRTIVVTGGNAGIGRAIAQQLAQAGQHVVIVSRDAGRGAAALAALRAETGGQVELVVGDLGSVAGVRRLADALLAQLPRLDVLINNAGIWPTRRALNADGLEMAFMVNHLAPFLLTHRLLPRLRASASARIVNVNAGLYVRGKLDLEKTPYGADFSALNSYANTKLCNGLFTVELARRLAGSGVTVNAVHPGVIRTRLGESRRPLTWLMRLAKRGWAPPEAGARAPVWLALAEEVAGVNGRYFNETSEALLSPAAQDAALARQLWTLSEKLAGVEEEILATD
ncbi:MAG: SDR family oxidoreductase [Anaerolineales bacterium]|nr:SDR family oxidoreductase [Anaerolineales bacterium]